MWISNHAKGCCRWWWKRYEDSKKRRRTSGVVLKVLKMRQKRLSE